VYVYGPETKDIFIYPTPENVSKIIYKDHANNCFSYEQQQVKCPKDASQIQVIPLQK
jgi:hypothetical protein